MNKILKYAGIPTAITLGWAGYLFGTYFLIGRRIGDGEGLILLGLMFVVVLICEAIQPSFK